MPVSHLLSTRTLTSNDVLDIIREAHGYLSSNGLKPQQHDVAFGRRVVLAFFEASTRTRLSFETAAHRLGADTVLFQPSGSSVEKGETLRETVLTIEAMGFDAIVLRHADNGTHETVASYTTMSVINAGEGSLAHPTQALLDASALMERCGTLEGMRICIVGDIRHSRVARSNIDVFTKLGADVAVCAPPALMGEDDDIRSLLRFESIPDALEWAQVINLLRIQRERMTDVIVPSFDDYRSRYALTLDRALAHPDTVVIHPGPVNVGVEADAAVLDLPQTLIHRQVSHGVAVRMAVLRRILTDRPTAT